MYITGENPSITFKQSAQLVSPYINVTPAAVYVCKIKQAQSLQRAVTMLQGDLHGFLEITHKHFR